MKIKNTGNKDAVWWVGKIIKCEPCGREIELELSDQSNPLLTFTREVVNYKCEVCNNTAMIANHKNTTTGTTLLVEQSDQPKVIEWTPSIPLTQTTPPVAPAPASQSRNARVGSNVTSGFGDPFAGTSWGNNQPATSLTVR